MAEGSGGAAERQGNLAGATHGYSRQDVSSVTILKIRGFHVDVFGHVNHARYIEFLEEARWAFFDEWPALTDALHARGIIHAVVNINIDYKSQATVGDQLRIESRPIRIGRSTLVMTQSIKQADSSMVVVDANITNIFLDSAKGKATSVRNYFLAHWPEFSNLHPHPEETLEA